MSLHGWSAVFLGLLLYWVILTGSVVVLAQEINAWANPVPDVAVGELPTKVDHLIRSVIADQPPEYRDSVSAFIGDSGLMWLFIEGHNADAGEGEPHHLQERFIELNPATGEVVTEYDMLREDQGLEPRVRGDNRAEAIGELGEFFVEWHVSLHLPRPWGLLLTGILGLAMLVASITGFLLHRHLFKELFTLRRFKGGLLKERDAHVVAGTWSLPFAFVLAFTGSFFSLAGSFAIPAVAMVNFGGDQDQLVRELVGVNEAGKPAVGSLTNLDALLADTRARFGLTPTSLQLLNSGTDTGVVRVGALPADGDLVPRTFEYDALSGEYLTERPLIGRQASAGATGVGLMGPLHFGNFAGLASKIVWLALGLAGAYVSFTGLTLFTRRREDRTTYRWLAVANIALGYGLPMVLVLCSVSFFVAMALGAKVEPVMMTTLAVTLVGYLIVTALKRHDLDGISRTFRLALGIGLLALPAVRMLTGGPGWASAFADSLVWVVSIDAAVVLAGLAFVRPGWFRLPASLQTAKTNAATAA